MLLKNDGSLNFETLKYSLEDLFFETPVFDIPPMSYDLEKKEKPQSRPKAKPNPVQEEKSILLIKF